MQGGYRLDRPTAQHLHGRCLIHTRGLDSNALILSCWASRDTPSCACPTLETRVYPTDFMCIPPIAYILYAVHRRSVKTLSQRLC